MHVELIELTEDVTNPKPDRRVKHDWRCKPVLLKGLKLMVRRDDYRPPWDEGTVLPRTVMTMEGGYSHQSIERVGRHDTHPLVSLVLASSRSVPKTGVAALAELGFGPDAADLFIDVLYERGVITDEHLAVAARAIDEESDA